MSQHNGERRTSLEAVEVTPMVVDPAQVVMATAGPVEEQGSAETTEQDEPVGGDQLEITPVVAVAEEPVVVQASLVRSLSTMRPMLRTTGSADMRGVPFCTCECEGLTAGLSKLVGLVMGCIGYSLIGATIVLSAGGIARLLAATSLYGAGLGFVAWLLCSVLFCCCAACWFFIARKADMDEPEMCPAVWCILGILASILCIVLAHIADKIHYMESAAPPVAGVDPRATEASWGYPDFLQQDNVREISFMPGSYIDIGLGVAYVDDVSRDW
jgi:hypothetical protein